ncbi:uncharacterized protein C8Q71DRAFT_471839 [Rhodofomes roseus]|uniref:C2H2-type domain-containing protein n=1 Tax=Rhodofomes roseus TaxID=34475 RepID=A0ABQ8KNS7_9APHY|nr:uncharacterized protein C8Q71DRAFT_471839 [Rhodofomes roseus]KAH9839981.1 hypothetical protein C8Q71DRAFT_471839 [Rhodofomes roseus]
MPNCRAIRTDWNSQGCDVVAATQPSQTVLGSPEGESCFAEQYPVAVDGSAAYNMSQGCLDAAVAEVIPITLGAASMDVHYDLVVEIFCLHNASCAVLPLAAWDIITMMHDYILGSHGAAFESSPDILSALPVATASHPQLHDPDGQPAAQPALLMIGTLPEGDDGQVQVQCKSDDCRRYLLGTRTASINRHLLRYHFADTEAQWMISEDRIRFRWDGCGRLLLKRMLATHTRITHLQCGKVQCKLPGCGFAKFNRRDALTRHLKQAHGISSEGGSVHGTRSRTTTAASP